MFTVYFCCDMCGYKDHTKLVSAKVDTEHNDVYLQVECPNCEHKATISMTSMVRNAMKTNGRCSSGMGD